MDGMVNTCELSINVVMSTKPKMLPGLRQKGTGAGTGSREYPVMATQRSRRRESPSPVRVNRVERGKPVVLLSQTGKKAVRPTEGDAGKGGGKSEGRPVMGRIRVAPRLLATSPGAQAGRLPYGVSAREPRRNRYRRCCK
jgi:hypothetical protein